MTTFTLSSHIAYLGACAHVCTPALERSVHQATDLLAANMRKKFGTYQPAVGGFPAWAPLAESTKEQRVKQGYTPNDPLLRSGTMRGTTYSHASGTTGEAGVNSPIMVYHEAGTSRIPPRPVVGPANVEVMKSPEMAAVHKEAFLKMNLS